MKLPTFLRTAAFCSLPLVTLSAAAPSRLSPEQIASLQSRFAGVKAWHISFRYSGDNPHQWTDGGTHHNRTRWHESSQGSFILPTTENDGTHVRVVGEGPSSDAVDLYRVSRSSPVHVETRYDRGSGPAKVAVDLTLDLETGTYDLSFISNEFPETYGGSQADAFETRTYGPAEGRTHVILPIPAPADIILRLPQEGTTISGSWSHQQEMQARPRHVPGFDVQEYAEQSPTRGVLTWTISPADFEPLDVELIVEPVGYESWLPEGGPDEATAGNTLAVKATLVAKNGGPLKHHATQMTFTLAEVSREKGLALNWPLTGGSDAPDLGFEARRNPDGEVLAAGQGLRFSHGPFDSQTATLSAFDWGACGAVVVVARLDNGRTVTGHLKGATVPDVLIPKRAASSAIGDAWKSAVGFSGSDAEDEDVQPGNTHPGDGLTAYEEYRGLVLDGRHSRRTKQLDPLKKDLVVINEIGAQARPGMKLFESAAGIHVVEAAATDLPATRQVNPGRGTASGGEQFALRLRTAKLAGETAGENRPAGLLNKTPKKSEEVVVDLALAAEFYAQQAAVVKAAGERMPYSLEQDVANTLAHEMGHGVGAPHHGRTSEYFGKREVTAKMVDWKVFGIDGLRVTVTEAEPVKLTGRIGRPGNEASGDAGCIMAYANFYQWAAVGREGGPYTFYALPPQAPGTHFCTSSAASGYNLPHKLANGAALPAFFGPARGQGNGSPVGNCLGAMQVRDW